MYNRYIPRSDGSYQKNRVPDQSSEPPKQQYRAPEPPQPVYDPPAVPVRKPDSVTGFLRQLLPKDFDTGDLLVVLLMLLMAGDCESERSNAMLTLAIYFFL